MCRTRSRTVHSGHVGTAASGSVCAVAVAISSPSWRSASMCAMTSTGTVAQFRLSRSTTKTSVSLAAMPGPGGLRSVAEAGGDDQLALSPDLHADHALVPAGDHLPRTQLEREGLARPRRLDHLARRVGGQDVLHGRGRRRAAPSHPMPVMRSALSSAVGGVPLGTTTVGACPNVPAGERSAAGMGRVACSGLAAGLDRRCGRLGRCPWWTTWWSVRPTSRGTSCRRPGPGRLPRRWRARASRGGDCGRTCGPTVAARVGSAAGRSAGDGARASRLAPRRSRRRRGGAKTQERIG